LRAKVSKSRARVNPFDVLFAVRLFRIIWLTAARARAMPKRLFWLPTRLPRRSLVHRKMQESPDRMGMLVCW
jgi:hypothetical protein